MVSYRVPSSFPTPLARAIIATPPHRLPLPDSRHAGPGVSRVHRSGAPSPACGKGRSAGRRESGRAGTVNASDDARVESMSRVVAILLRAPAMGPRIYRLYIRQKLNGLALGALFSYIPPFSRIFRTKVRRGGATETKPRWRDSQTTGGSRALDRPHPLGYVCCMVINGPRERTHTTHTLSCTAHTVLGASPPPSSRTEATSSPPCPGQVSTPAPARPEVGGR